MRDGLLRPRVVRRNMGLSAAATLVVAALVLPATSGAQTPPITSNAQTAVPAVTPASQSLVLGYTTRSYSVGDSAVTEGAANLSYVLLTGRIALSLDGSSVDYRVPGRKVTGLVPSSLRLDVMLRPGDTVTFLGRTRSQPGSLDSSQTAALSLVGSSLVDLQAFSLGSQSMVGGRATFAFPVGELVLSVRGGLEYEPRPSSTSSIYWQGTTVRGGATLLGNFGLGTLSAAADVSYGSADSLRGNNLYPGGGYFSVVGTLSMPRDNPLNKDGDPWDSVLLTYWGMPLAASRTDQPNLLLPVGMTMGVSGALTAPVRDGSISSTADFIRTASNASSASGSNSATSSSTGWALSVGLDAVVPLSSHFDLVPQTGYTLGNASLTFTQSSTTVTRRGRPIGTTSGSTQSDSMRGWWLGLALSASF